MAHKEGCKEGPEGRGSPRDIITYAKKEGGLVYIATALNYPEGSYYCCDPECRVELVPRKGSKSIPFISQTGEQGLYDRRAHFAAKGEHPQQGPRQAAVSHRQTAIDMVVSLLYASDHYDKVYNAVSGNGLSLDIQYQRKKGEWWRLTSHPADIVARTKGGIDMLIQVEEQSIASRYGNTNNFIRRVGQIANTGHRFILNQGGSAVELSNRIYQTTVALMNDEYYRTEEEGIVMTPTETVLLQGFFDQINILDLEHKELVVPTVEIDHKTKKAMIVSESRMASFFFTEETYGRKDWRRFEEKVANRPRRVVIPELRVAKPRTIVFDQATGKPIPQDSNGQLFLL